MALQKTVTYKGITINDAYLKIWHIEGDKTTMKFGLGTFAQSDGDMIDSKSYSFSYDIDGANPIQQGYSYLKTLPDYSDATDI